MSGAEIPIILAAVGTGTQIYGQISAASAQAEAQKKDAEFKNIQANELLAREALNEIEIRRQGELTTARYSSAAAASGFETSGIGGQLDILDNVERMITNSNREARFKADMLRLGANVQTDLASDMVTSSYLTGAGTAIKTGASMYNALRKPGKAEEF